MKLSAISVADIRRQIDDAVAKLQKLRAVIDAHYDHHTAAEVLSRLPAAKRQVARDILARLFVDDVAVSIVAALSALEGKGDSGAVDQDAQAIARVHLRAALAALTTSTS